MCEAAGVRLEYLPPYSPDYNPIEESFSILKRWIQHNRKLVESFEGNFDMFLHLAVRHCGTDKHAKAHFRHAQVNVDEEIGLDNEI